MAKKDIEYYIGEIKKRDIELSRLKKENLVLLKSALKQAEKNHKLSEHARKLLEINRRLSKKSKI